MMENDQFLMKPVGGATSIFFVPYGSFKYLSFQGNLWKAYPEPDVPYSFILYPVGASIPRAQIVTRVRHDPKPVDGGFVVTEIEQIPHYVYKRPPSHDDGVLKFLNLQHSIHPEDFEDVGLRAHPTIPSRSISMEQDDEDYPFYYGGLTQDFDEDLDLEDLWGVSENQTIDAQYQGVQDDLFAYTVVIGGETLSFLLEYPEATLKFFLALLEETRGESIMVQALAAFDDFKVTCKNPTLANEELAQHPSFFVSLVLACRVNHGFQGTIKDLIELYSPLAMIEAKANFDRS
jgi:hypothetical protein